MAATANVALRATLTGQLSGTQTTEPAALTFATAVGQRLIVTLTTGANTFAIPATTTMVVVVLPPANTQTCLWKVVTGDQGWALQKTMWGAMPVDASVTTSFVLTAGGTIVGAEITYL